MSLDPNRWAEAPEMLIIGLAKVGDQQAFGEVVRRYQSWVRNLMRRFSNDPALADDLAQEVFLTAWKNISQLNRPDRFRGWLKRMAVNHWLQYLRKNDALRGAGEITDVDQAQLNAPGMAIDLDRALSALPAQVRMCIVLSYSEGMTHGEIAEMTDFPLGTVKSHIRRGTQRLQEILEPYNELGSHGEA